MAGETSLLTTEANPKRVVVRFNGKVVADSRRAVTLREGRLRPVHYIPREDVAMDLLVRSTGSSHCPLKGDAAYFTIRADGRTAHDAVWTYEDPLPAVAAIRGHLAFYQDRVDGIEEMPEAP